MVVRACQALISSGKSTINILGDRAVAVERLGRTAQSMKYLRKLYRRNRNVESLELLTSFYARHGNINGRFSGRYERLAGPDNHQILPAALRDLKMKLQEFLPAVP